MLSSAEHLLAVDAPVVRHVQGMRTSTHAVAGVSAARVGRLGDARRHLLRSALARPWSPMAWGRVVVSLSPATARRVWGTTGSA
jgi:hypothetical protein